MTAKIGIIAEHKPGEGRIPLIPAQIASLMSENPDLDIVVQHSVQRVFKDTEFVSKGITMAQEVSDANFVMAVKEIAVKDIHAKGAYLYFSHTIKGQDYNMPMLQHILDVGATLIDYELIKDSSGRRLVFFGRHAGLAGMVNSLWSYGQRLSIQGVESPFLKIKQAFHYGDLPAIKEAISGLGTELQAWLSGRPPIVVAVTGYGNVSKGAQEILDLLPLVELSAQDLIQADLSEMKGQLIKVVFKESDMFKPIDPAAKFVLQDYFDHPEKYQSQFNEYLGKLNILVNCIYWDTPYPRLITLDEIKEHYQTSATLKVVGDVTCDIDGSIQFNTGSTLSPDPCYVYDPETGKRHMGFEGSGPVVMAVDNLPTELPREASEAFGEALIPFVPAMGRCDYSMPFEALELPPEVKGAVITHDGELTPNFRYLESFLGG